MTSLSHFIYLVIVSSLISLNSSYPSTYQNWWNSDPNIPAYPTDSNNQTYYGYHRESFVSPTGGRIYRTRPEARRQSRNPTQIKYQEHDHSNGILVGDICDPDDPVYNKCTPYAHCNTFENNLSRCNCTEGFDITSEKKCRLSWGQYCTSKEACNFEAGLVCIDNRCECENSDIYQFPSKTCRSKVGGTCTPPATQVGVRFSKSNTNCVKNALCRSFGPSGLSFRCVCKNGFVESRHGYCSAGVGTPCHGKGECDSNVPLVCKQGVCACRDSLHVYDPTSNTCVGLSGAQCCTDPDGLRCISAIRTGCVEGAFCKDSSLNLPGRCVCLPFNMETEERLCKSNPNL